MTLITLVPLRVLWEKPIPADAHDAGPSGGLLGETDSP